MVYVNYLSVLLAALAAMIVGYIWYGPLFGKKWMAYIGGQEDTEKETPHSMAKSYAINYIASAVMAFVLAYFIKILGVTDFAGALIISIWVWVGFIATTSSLASVIWEKKPWGYYFLNAFYYLFSILAMSLILTFLG